MRPREKLNDNTRYETENETPDEGSDSEKNTHIHLRLVEHKETPTSLVKHAMEDLIEDHLREPTKTRGQHSS